MLTSTLSDCFLLRLFGISVLQLVTTGTFVYVPEPDVYDESASHTDDTVGKLTNALLLRNIFMEVHAP